MNETLVSIIIPCYNQAHYLDDALQSVLDQTYSNWECIIVNDGSPDNTESMSKKWIELDERFRYLRKENGGLSSARNAGLEISHGEWIQFLDADDYLSPAKLQESISSLLHRPDAKLIVTNFSIFSDNKSVWEHVSNNLNEDILTYDNILYEWGGKFVIPIHCGLFNAEISRHIKFNNKFRSIEDWIFWLDYFKFKFESVYINKPLALYRKNSEGLTSRKTEMNISLLQAYLYILENLPENYVKPFSESIFKRLMNRIEKYESKLFYYENQNKYRALAKAIIKILLRK